MVDDAWIQWGAELARQRSLAGKTQQELARSALLSRQQISALEKGARKPKADHADTLDSALATGGILRKLWGRLTEHQEVPPEFRDVLQVEGRAAEIREYQPIVIPGLLQTHEYARAILSTSHSRRSPEQVNEVARVRTERLGKIAPGRPLLWFVIRSSVLARVVGGTGVMAAQLRHLARLARDGVRVQVLPDASVDAGLYPPFRVSALRDTQSLAYVEHPLGGMTIGEPEKVSELWTIFAALQAEAMSPRDSVRLIRNLQGRL
ncbi:helix-turn-helix transcriptional regulator [Streptomonospora arabica]|uniref:Helix-turn-helix transcriptional regulator n=1 Tax=Streptomonospora arabica TaxID=412417 RepID=A0ABV9SG00_9ACTN